MAAHRGENKATALENPVTCAESPGAESDVAPLLEQVRHSGPYRMAETNVTIAGAT